MAIAIYVKKIDKNCKVEREEKEREEIEREEIEREERKISTPAVLFSLSLRRPLRAKALFRYRSIHPSITWINYYCFV
ncbi:hypothetical protein [Lactococcus cremoris]|uniref:hypothetical protein n=1 Tax=Lactococcus lactis subsp. cremoris TaxID=1359 RepID=UPI0021AA81F9|nr:hypothetical protein [Lactococcus cremoris]